MFRSNSIIEIHKDGAWVPAAEIRGVEGHRAFFEYHPEYRFSDNPLPVSLAYPVDDDPAGVTEDGAPTCPAFMYDLVPQVSQGRGYLLEDIGRRLLLPNFWMRLHDESLDFLLAQCGALNPVGNLRLNSAVNFWREQGYDQIRHPEGFTRQELLKLNEEFAEEVGALNSGITCVQGASQKFLITENYEGVWFPDANLDDSEAALHWLVKMVRGSKKAHSDILRMESIYFSIARDCGIRTHGECYTEKDMLFIERFDRRVEDGRVIRLHQESLLSVAGIPGFHCSVSLFTLADAIARHATDPAQELAEFIKRDLLNHAMGNTDNHGRNTAMQRLPDGTVQLTPL